MKVSPAAAGLAVLVVAVMGISHRFSRSTERFACPTASGKGSMSYQCAVLDNPEETRANALSAQDYFEPLFLEATRPQVIAIHAAGRPDRQASDIIPDLETINAAADALRQEADSEIHSRFACRFKAEPA